MADSISPTATPSPPTLTTPQYSLVHDAYGPGAFLAWLLAAYILAFQFAATIWNPARRQHWITDKDLAMVLVYPFFAAAHLANLMMHYPGAKDKIWNMESFYQEGYRTPVQDLEHAYAVRAAARVCTVGLAVNMVLYATLSGKKWRRIVVGGVSAWVFIALEFASWDCGWWTFLAGTVLTMLWSAGLFIFLPIFIATPLWFAHHGLKWVIEKVPQARKAWKRYRLRVVAILFGLGLFYVPFALLMWVGLWGMAWGDLTIFLMPQSRHPVTEIFQAMALVLGVVNTLCTLREMRGRGDVGMWGTGWS